jgi:hypothetical protein
VGATSSALNKGGGPRVLVWAEMKTRQMFVPTDLGGISCFGRLRWRPPMGASCLEVAGSDRIQSCAPIFYLSVGLRGSVVKLCEALLAVTIICHDFLFQGEVN